MHRYPPPRSTVSPQDHAPLWLAAAGGRRLDSPGAGVVVGADHPEVPMEIEFFGLTDGEQRAALAAFPGGRRFVLVRRG